MNKAHVIGVCGKGMSATAHLLQGQGYVVSGSDAGFYPPVSDYVETLGITTYEGYKASNVPQNPDLIVIGMNAKLREESNEEVRFARENYPDVIKSFPEVLEGLTLESHNIVVTGSYGKSTLTTLITWILDQAGKNPNYVIGEAPKQFEHSARIQNDVSLCVLEGDEYPSAHWDDQSKFLHYNPNTVLLTAACHDHINIYPTLDDYHKPFKALLHKIESTGKLVACVDESNAKALYESHKGEKVSYGYDSTASWSCYDEKYGSQSTAIITHNGQDVVKVQTVLLGRHNMQNIIGAAAVLLGGNLISPEQFTKGLRSFEGIVRRLDTKVTETCSVRAYEGFGSSYEKARSAIDAMNLHFPDSRITVVFEPHTFTWRNRGAIDQYEDAFTNVDTVWIYQPPTQGAGTHEQLSLEEIVGAASKHHRDIRTFDAVNWQDMVQDQQAGDVVLILSSANFDGLQEKIIQQIERNYQCE